MKPTAIVLAFLLCGLVVLSACSKGSAPQPDESVSPPAAASRPPCGVAGIALLNRGGPPTTASPTPSPLPGGFGNSTDWPLKGSHLTIVALSGERTGQVVARLLSDADGLFAAQLPPGRYEVRGRFPHQPVAGKAAFTVTAGRFTRVMVQGGIIY